MHAFENRRGRPAVATADLVPNPHAPYWLISRVLVPEEMRGKGLGGHMLELLKWHVRLQGVYPLVVAPGGYGSDEKRQRRFYSERGFTYENKQDWFVCDLSRLVAPGPCPFLPLPNTLACHAFEDS
jgi:hypothetical protein